MFVKKDLVHKDVQTILRLLNEMNKKEWLFSDCSALLPGIWSNGHRILCRGQPLLTLVVQCVQIIRIFWR